MQDDNLDSDDFDADFNQWLVGGSPEKGLSSKKLFTTIEYESYGPKPLKLRKPKFDAYVNVIEDDGYRNPGGGDGRPVSFDPASKSISIRMTISQHAKFLSLGGCKWIKKIIDEVE